ncbi:hypothetical protein PRIPAC_72179 [Pristionchus pacificus]|uniref:Uncharacterized protein n=1 Tax=Pristionchus pacificus TaxID=54126 RepID=A0A2A6C6C3_PRIPA|nr:hypothetical protein PRIPAC_72179 [Pristionchus pacificus]|eukprot:PDM73714.1 hypothetical protein PRIPAC_41070 [Pristionchus pacificus]
MRTKRREEMVEDDDELIVYYYLEEDRADVPSTANEWPKVPSTECPPFILIRFEHCLPAAPPLPSSLAPPTSVLAG